MKTGIRRYLRAAGDLVVPRGCLVCGRRLNLEERHVCLGCLVDMPLTRYWERRRNPMADRFNERIQERVEREWDGLGSEDEGKLAVGHERYAFAAALFFYHSEAGYRYIPQQIKYHGNLGAGRFFGGMLGRRLAEAGGGGLGSAGWSVEEAGLWADVDMIIPVPLHWIRRWRRGYNQAEVIAGAVAEAMGVAMRTDVLVRRRRTKSQVKVSVAEKGRNVGGAFAVSEDAAVIFRDGGSVRHILLVDDVFTTGSTLTACHEALREVFPPSVRISAVTLGYLER